MEHPFGTIKRQWGFDHIMTKKTKQRASADIGFIFIAYNLKPIWNIEGIKAFEKLSQRFLYPLSGVIKLFQSVLSKISAINHISHIFELYLTTNSKMSILATKT